MDQIIPGLWIGDLACALATDYLSIAGITHIVTAMKQRLPSPITLPDGRVIDQEHMFHVNLDDVDNAPILVHFPAAADFIDSALEHDWLEDDDDDDAEQEEGERVREEPPSGRGPGQWATMGEGTVLVHCHAGISRSVALVTAYLMRTRQMGRDEALKLIQSRRSQACPNPGFMHQLELFESGGYNVDVRNQRIRRFLMSQSSILRGDSIDDVMLSYYPSPFHSPANSFTSVSGTALGGLQQLSSLDNDSAPQSRQMARRGSSASAYGGSASPVSSLAMSRQNSRKAVSTAAAKVGSERHRRTRSRSEGMLSCANPPRSLASMTTLVPTKDHKGKILDLSKSPPISDQSMELFDEDDDSTSGALRDEKLQNLIRQQFSSVRDPQEVMITVSSKNLPGGVTKVRGNQTTTDTQTTADAAHDTDKSGSARQLSANGTKPAVNAQRLPKPHFHGRKLRCKKCRRELAAQDHVVEHEPGKGKDAFDVRKREKDVEQKSRDGRLAMGGGASDGRSSERQMSLEERFGAQKRPDKTEEEQEQEQEPSTAAPPPPASAYKSAASLSAQLPPHLAALRLGRNPAGGGLSTPTSPTQSLLDNGARRPSEQHPGGTTNGSGDLRRLLHSPLCTSYFVEPLAWMSGLRLGDVAGRLDCPNQRCSAKLGSWDWAGMQCACGAWVTPAFALHRSKVDEV